MLKGLASLLEIAALGVDAVGNDVLDHGLGSAVGVCRANRAVLGDGNHVGNASSIAVDGCRGREDNVADVVLLHRAHECDATANIDAVVLERDLARLADSFQRSEVNDTVNVWVLGEDIVDGFLVGDVNLVEFGSAAANLLNAINGDFGRVV